MQCQGVNSKKKPCGLKIFENSKYCRYHKKQELLEKHPLNPTITESELQGWKDKKLSDFLYQDLEFLVLSYLDLECVSQALDSEKLDKVLRLYYPEVPNVEHEILQNNYGTVKLIIPRIIKPIKKYADYACKLGRLEILKYFRELGTRYSNGNLSDACKYGHLEVLKFFEKLRLSPDVESLRIACLYDRVNIMEYLMKKGIKITDQIQRGACWHSNFETIKFLVDSGIVFNDQHITRLKNSRKYEAVRYILSKRDSTLNM